MKLHSVSKVVAAALVLVLLAACPASMQQKTPLEQAKLTYFDASLGYEVAMNSVSPACVSHQLSPEVCKSVGEAEKKVQQIAPVLAQLFQTWESTGTKPLTFDSTLQIFIQTIAQLQGLQQGIH